MRITKKGLDSNLGPGNPELFSNPGAAAKASSQKIMTSQTSLFLQRRQKWKPQDLKKNVDADFIARKSFSGRKFPFLMVTYILIGPGSCSNLHG